MLLGTVAVHSIQGVPSEATIRLCLQAAAGPSSDQRQFKQGALLRVNPEETWGGNQKGV